MKTLFWVLTIIGCCVGAFVLVVGVTTASGAPQEAAAAGIALSFAVIPYCLARAISEMSGNKKNNIMTKEESREEV